MFRFLPARARSSFVEQPRGERNQIDVEDVYSPFRAVLLHFSAQKKLNASNSEDDQMNLIRQRDILLFG